MDVNAAGLPVSMISWSKGEGKTMRAGKSVGRLRGVQFVAGLPTPTVA